MATLTTHWLTESQYRILVRHWVPKGDIVGVIHLIHGMMEHSGFYHDWALKLCNLGWAVVAHDHPGAGLTLYENTRLDTLPMGSDQLLVNATDCVDQWIRTQYPNKKLVRYGHSMGSFVAIQAELKIGPSNGLILTSSTYEPKWVTTLQAMAIRLLSFPGNLSKRAKLAMVIAFGPMNWKFRPNRTKYDWISQEEHVVDMYINDQYCGNMPNWGVFHSVNKLLAGLNNRKRFKRMNHRLPICFITGSRDPLSNGGKKIRTLIRQLTDIGIQRVEHHIINNARHKIEYDTHSEEILTNIKKWLRSV